MEKLLTDYREWLLRDHSARTTSSVVARVKRISKSYDILNEYAMDHCANIIDLFTYSKVDQKLGEEPKADIVIDGSYYTGMASLRQALVSFVEFLNSIHYVATVKKSKSVFCGSFDDFKRFIGPKCRNEVNIFCKSEREKHSGICEYCGRKAVLDSAHIVERPIIIKAILDEYYKKGADYYEVDLYEFMEKFKEAHMPIEKHVFFLCKKCHADLDKAKTIKVEDIFKKR